MAAFKCKLCGGDVVPNEDKTTGTCERCGSVMTLPEIEELEAKEEADRLEHERRVEQWLALRKKRNTAVVIAVSVVAAVCIAFVILLITVLIPNGKYNAALDLYASGKYDEAIAAFTAMNDYKDSKEQIAKCKEAIEEAQYNTALALIEQGDFINAYESLIALRGYKDSTQKANEIFEQYKKAKLKSAVVGDVVRLGSYEQDNDPSNGKEEIEWLILEKEGGKALVISKYAIDCQPYHTSDTSVTWETSSLREWLNKTFFDAAFSMEEQNYIETATVKADKNPQYNTAPGNDTTDKVFLLSVAEAYKYFISDEARKCAPTDYAVAQGVWTSLRVSADGRDTCWWWLRSLGEYSHGAADVYVNGSISARGHAVDSAHYGVRPVMWIDLET